MRGRRQPFGIDEVLRRGVERGEIDPERLTPRISSVALDLMRHEMVMTLHPVPEEVIAEIVDDIFLPWSAPGELQVQGRAPCYRFLHNKVPFLARSTVWRAGPPGRWPTGCGSRGRAA
ncbi:TetR-like C-terminal domain-containing protein [Phytohabitans rumicis]|uniref:TetR-like C-terminal domain-containing protein n=1 Tax=Phytohabitans rumicis TaxID=1076125 RepID=UPI003530C884